MNGYQITGVTTIILLFVAVWFIFCIRRAERESNEDQDEQL
jgi:heme/copper-type cytochrome/quinol oxidase subunit 2